MRPFLPRLSLALIATALAGGVLVVGLRLSTALEQFSATLAPPSTEADAARHGGAAAMDPQGQSAVGVHIDERAAAAPAVVATYTDTDAAVPSVSGTIATEGAVDEREFSLEYFGNEVSLNDIGELAVPDPEFERAIRVQANEHGEIEAAN